MNSSKPPLILGTAEFNPNGYNGLPALATKEMVKILGLAKEAGINIIDTAETYYNADIIRRYAKGFCIYTKTRDWRVTLNWGRNELRGILYHYQPGESPIELPHIHRWVNLGLSVYDLAQCPSDPQKILQVPFGAGNTQFMHCFGIYRTVFARSVFGNGELFKKGLTVKDCLDFVIRYRPDGIIIGVNSEKELKKILEVY